LSPYGTRTITQQPNRIAGATEVRIEVRPSWVFKLPRHGGPDGLTRIRSGVLHRLLHVDDVPVLVRAAQLAPDRVLFGGRAASRAAAEEGIARVRQALGIDRDLRPFYERFRFDPLIGQAVCRNPGLRVHGKPDPFEALVWAICEQLIELTRAAEIQRRMVAALGRRCPATGMRDAPSAAALASQNPALLQSLDLSYTRSCALVKAANEVACGRVDLRDPDHERGWRRLRVIPGIGSWTLQMLGLTGQARLDQLPAGDLAYLKLVGRLRYGDPRARATETEVEAFFEPYAPWSGLAGMHALRAGWVRGSAVYSRTRVNSSVSHGARASARNSASSVS
jgi:3-methyladenine DNA glycosylase/8-oxoguanine DNA glycosylase